jgi:predicted ester cyclase
VTARDHEHLVARFYDDMWNRFDTTVLADIVSPAIRFRGSLGQTRTGIEELVEYVEYVRTFSADFHNTVVDTISDDRRTFARLACTGTHLGEFFGIAAHRPPIRVRRGRRLLLRRRPDERRLGPR